jgi:hypothetical protein
VSSRFLVPLSDRSLAIHCSSHDGSGVMVQFLISSGDTQWSTLARMDGTGAAFIVHSGTPAGFGIVPRVPSPWCRILLAAAPSTDPRSFTILQVN